MNQLLCQEGKARMVAQLNQTHRFMKSRLSALSCLICGLLLQFAAAAYCLANPPLAMTPKLKVSVTGVFADRISLETAVADDLDITNSELHTLDFVSAYQQGNYFLDAVLLIEYQQNDRVLIPIQLADDIHSINIPVNRWQTLRCNYSTWKRKLGVSSQSKKVRFERYVAAQLLANDIANEKCGRDVKREIAKIWFDRSYELAVSYPYVDIDKDAIAHARENGLRRYINPYLLRYNFYEVSLILDKARHRRSENPSQAKAMYDYVIAEIENQVFGQHWRANTRYPNRLSDIKRERDKLA